MSIDKLFIGLADVLNGATKIEQAGRKALLEASDFSTAAMYDKPLPKLFLDVMTEDDAHPVCNLIADAQFCWEPPQTSSDPAYIAHSTSKVHVELLGPDGLVKSNDVRLGLYGILPNAEYGLRTHPAEEVFVMLAGEADWKRGDADYQPHKPGDRSYHPSMLPHATRSRDKAFMSIYIWHGDISTENYVYQGLPGGRD